MKQIITISILIFSYFLNASEMQLGVGNKVGVSDTIVIGKVSSIELGKIGNHLSRNIWDKSETQEVKITLEVEKTFLGKAEPKIQFTAYSHKFTREDGTGQWSTAGFNFFKPNKGQKFIVYLRKEENKYFLAGNSNQYFVHVDETKSLVKGLGQTWKYTSLEQRLLTLKEAIKKRK